MLSAEARHKTPPSIKSWPRKNNGSAKGSKRAARATKAGCARSNACAKLRRERREQPGKVRMQIQADKRSGKLVIEAEKVSYAFGDQPVVRDFSTTIQRGDKVGIIGPNGSGKTTLLRLLMGELVPQQGDSWSTAPTSKSPTLTNSARSWMKTNPCWKMSGRAAIPSSINGQPRNLIGYLEDFLFTRDRVQAPISALSGGERNRLLLARLFARPANLLVLDEPTNDLDIETLEILEDLLLDYTGTLLLVSHDRAFLNNLVTSTLVLDGSGQVSETVGGYDDWQRQNQAANSAKPEQKPRNWRLHKHRADFHGTGPENSVTKNSAPSKPKKRELAELPQRIEALEADIHALSAMAAPAFYQQDSAEITRAANRLNFAG